MTAQIGDLLNMEYPNFFRNINVDVMKRLLNFSENGIYLEC